MSEESASNLGLFGRLGLLPGHFCPARSVPGIPSYPYRNPLGAEMVRLLLNLRSMQWSIGTAPT